MEIDWLFWSQGWWVGMWEWDCHFKSYLTLALTMSVRGYLRSSSLSEVVSWGPGAGAGAERSLASGSGLAAPSLKVSSGSALARPLVKVRSCWRWRAGAGCRSRVSVRRGLRGSGGGAERLYELSCRGGGGDQSGVVLGAGAGISSPSSLLAPSLVFTRLGVRELSRTSRDSSREPDWSRDTGGSCQEDAVSDWRKDDKSCKWW